MNLRTLSRLLPVFFRRHFDGAVAAVFCFVCLLLGVAAWAAWKAYISQPPYVDAGRFPVRGFDISAHNGYANLDAAAAAGYDFVFLKATEGLAHKDPNFVLNYQKARHAGLKVGAYHYFRFDSDGIGQARHLLRTVGPRPLELGLAIDVEEAGNATGIPLDTIRYRLQTMAEYLNMKGHRVTFYSNRDGWSRYLVDDFEGQPLWICSFNSGNASAGDWTFWQYDHRGRVPGVRGDVDLNVFCGSRDDWEKMY